jgi:hypothetical protein
MDPETGLDATRNIGISNGKVSHRERASERQARHSCRRPGGCSGFIDPHQHGQDLASQKVKALDGVTTALELEIGAPDVAEFLTRMKGHSLINYGTAASHVAARAAVFGAPLTPASSGITPASPRSCPKADQPRTCPPHLNRSPQSATVCGRNSTPEPSQSAWEFSTHPAPRVSK